MSEFYEDRSENENESIIRQDTFSSIASVVAVLSEVQLGMPDEDFSTSFHHYPDTDICMICMEQFTSRTRVIFCGHYFDLACIQKWLSSSTARNCPYCRRPISALQEIADNDQGYISHALAQPEISLSYEPWEPGFEPWSVGMYRARLNQDFIERVRLISESLAQSLVDAVNAGVIFAALEEPRVANIAEETQIGN